MNVVNIFHEMTIDDNQRVLPQKVQVYRACWVISI